MADVDIVIPCYNYDRFLMQSVSSVLDQQGVDLRLLIIDNASEDDSLAVANRLAADDARVEVIGHAHNRGATFSYNEGIDWAQSRYFLILDADDLLVPGALARATTLMDKEPSVSFTHGGEARLDGSEVTINGFTYEETGWDIIEGRELITRLCRTPVNVVGANTVIRRTSAQKHVGYYRETLRYTDDLEMWMRLSTVGCVAGTRTVQAIRRYHEGRGSDFYQSFQVRDFIERERAFASFFAHEGSTMPDATALMAMARRGLGEHAYWSAVAHLARGQFNTGRQLFAMAHERRRLALHTPPVGWLARMDHPFGRAGKVMSDAMSVCIAAFLR